MIRLWLPWMVLVAGAASGAHWYVLAPVGAVVMIVHWALNDNGGCS